MTLKPTPLLRTTAPHARGISLLFALLALVAMSLAAVALVRSVDTSAMVMGNLGFKQDATARADQVTQAAIVALSNMADLTTDDASAGYYATAHESIDATGQRHSDPTRALINWDMDGCDYASEASQATCVVSPAPEEELDNGGGTARYAIFRLCSQAGSPEDPGNQCARPKPSMSAGEGSEPGETDSNLPPKRREIKYGEDMRFTDDPDDPPGTYQGVYYRIVVRVIGARNSTSFVETIVHL